MIATYLTVGLVAAGISFAGGLRYVYRESHIGDRLHTDLLVIGVLLNLMLAPIVGAAWPIALLIAGIVLTCKYVKRSEAKRTEKRRAAQQRKLHEPTDSERYRNLAREQHNLARQARKDGMTDLADMQDGLADQYEQTARIYDRETA